MKIIDCIQGSDEWFDVKRGRVSASHFKDVLNKKTGRGLYMRKVAAERLTGQTEETYTNKNMENGIDTEAEARECYEVIYHEKVVQVGFVVLNEWVGCSPDGLIGDDGLAEIKCPLGSTHIEYIEKDAMPAVYAPQVQGQLWVTGRKWCDFISYNPYFNSRPLWSTRIQRDAEYIKNLEAATNVFVAELKELIAKVEKGAF
jgi:putative phage-type endonuclease